MRQNIGQHNTILSGNASSRTSWWNRRRGQAHDDVLERAEGGELQFEQDGAELGRVSWIINVVLHIIIYVRSIVKLCLRNDSAKYARGGE
jgi:hypothetical protein